jgi:outer membrane protein insertion porin family
VSENGRLEMRYSYSSKELYDVDTNSSPILIAEEGKRNSSALGYTYTYDTRTTGIDPRWGMTLRFGQDVAGFGGDVEAITTTALARVERKILNEEVTLRAELEGGAIHARGDTKLTVLDRFSGNGKIRGFETNGYGPRDTTAVNEDALGGKYFAALRLESEFPLGTPEEYGIHGGAFLDVGSVWGLDDTAGFAGTVDDALHWRSSIGLSLFWTTPIGPLRFNFAHALKKEEYDLDRVFDLTISTKF